MYRFRMYSLLVAQLAYVICILLSSCGGDASSSGADNTTPMLSAHSGSNSTPNAPENSSPKRIPDPAQIPDCGDTFYDIGDTNGFGLTKILNYVESPTDLAFIPGSPSAFVVISQSGTVSYFNGSCDAINTIDVSSAENGGIGVRSEGEMGLLNIEFHPDYANNGYIFFYHSTVTGQANAVSRMTVSFSSNGNMELSDPVNIIKFRKNNFTVDHNGGGLVFAPDHTLLASVGDAEIGNGQDNNSMRGVVVRIDPSLAPGKGGYNIPPGNMFNAENPKCSDIDNSLTPCPEILTMGLRNPFRMSMDGDIVYLADVGNNNEEINSFDYVTASGTNFGWSIHDGFVESSSITNYRNPIVYYNRDDTVADGFRNEDPEGTKTDYAAVMIGDVYHGNQYGNVLNDMLLFGDFYDGFIRAVGVDNNGNITDTDGVPGEHIKHQAYVSSMHEGEDGFIYMTTYGNEVYRLVKQ
jgi:glucose/arabinose dehydrogenase